MRISRWSKKVAQVVVVREGVSQLNDDVAPAESLGIMHVRVRRTKKCPMYIVLSRLSPFVLGWWWNLIRLSDGGGKVRRSLCCVARYATTVSKRHLIISPCS